MLSYVFSFGLLLPFLVLFVWGGEGVKKCPSTDCRWQKSLQHHHMWKELVAAKGKGMVFQGHRVLVLQKGKIKPSNTSFLLYLK